MPDDSLVDAAGRLPAPVRLPRTDELQQAAGLYRTGYARYNVRNYLWRGLEAADPRAHHLAARVALAGPDLAAMMNRSHRLRAAGAAAGAATRRVACEWVAANAPRWAPWIPPACPPGAAAAGAAGCAPCPAGSSCPGGYTAAAQCPRGAFCPAGASAPTPCPAGLTTADAGAAAAGECGRCPSAGEVPLGAGGACVPLAALLAGLLLPLAALAAAAAAAAYHRRRLAGEDALWRIDADEVASAGVLVSVPCRARRREREKERERRSE
jgi:hypothetical protein